MGRGWRGEGYVSFSLSLSVFVARKHFVHLFRCNIVYSKYTVLRYVVKVQPIALELRRVYERVALKSWWNR